MPDSRQAVAAGLSVLSSAGIATLFLPALDSVWGADPARPDETRRQLSSGVKLYFGFVIAVGLGTSYSEDTLLPFLVALALALIVISTYLRAYRYRAPAKTREAFQ